MLRPALVTFGALAFITGLAYPLASVGIGRAAFRSQAEGSLIRRDGCIQGSRLVARPTEDPRCFWGRLSGGANLSPGNPALKERAEARIAALRALDPRNAAPIPVDLVTGSASDLDPHISPAAAEYQIARIARLRNTHADAIRALVRKHTAGRTLGFIGEPTVNVLELNLELEGRR